MTTLRKIIEYGLYFLIFLLPWQTRWIWKPGEWEYLTKSLYGTEMLLGIIFLLSVIYFTKNYRSLVINCRFILRLIFNWKKLLKIFLISLPLCFFVILSAILSEDPSLSFYHLSKIAVGGITIILIYAFADFTKTIYAFTAGAVVQAGIGIWQFLTQSSFSSKWLGLAMHDAAILGTSVVETMDGRWLRAYGALPHPNILAGYLAVAIILTIILYVQAKKGVRYQLSSGAAKLTLLVLTTALFFTFSRAAWIALFIFLLFYLLINLKNRTSFKKILELSFVCFLAAVVFSFLYLPLLGSRISNTNRLEVKSTNERIEYFSESFQIIKNYPFLGAGPGNYTLAVYNKIDSSHESFTYQPVHNIYLLILTEIGVLGAIFVLLLSYYLTISKRNFRLIILSPLLIIGLFDHYLISLYSGIILTSFILSLCFLYSKSKITG